MSSRLGGCVRTNRWSGGTWGSHSMSMLPGTVSIDRVSAQRRNPIPQRAANACGTSDKATGLHTTYIFRAAGSLTRFGLTQICSSSDSISSSLILSGCTPLAAASALMFNSGSFSGSFEEDSNSRTLPGTLPAIWDESAGFGIRVPCIGWYSLRCGSHEFLRNGGWCHGQSVRKGNGCSCMSADLDKSFPNQICFVEGCMVLGQQLARLFVFT